MREGQLIPLLILCAAVAAAMLGSTRPISAQNGTGREQKKGDLDEPPPFYNPYPSGILPADLPQEIERVRSEVRSIENEALAEWQALTPPTLTGQPNEVNFKLRRDAAIT